MIHFLNEQEIPAFFYFRNCTSPDEETRILLLKGRHQAGFHAESTRTLETFKEELRLFCSKGLNVTHFTKHGSGVLKLGKHHYPPYEPQRYKEWSKLLDIKYFSGNDIAASASQLVKRDEDGFWPFCFWVEENYRNAHFNSIDDFLQVAEKNDVVLLTHPENFYTHKKIRDDISYIIAKAAEKNINWIDSVP